MKSCSILLTTSQFAQVGTKLSFSQCISLTWLFDRTRPVRITALSLPPHVMRGRAVVVSLFGKISPGIESRAREKLHMDAFAGIFSCQRQDFGLLYQLTRPFLDDSFTRLLFAPFASGCCWRHANHVLPSTLVLTSGPSGIQWTRISSRERGMGVKLGNIVLHMALFSPLTVVDGGRS